MKKTLLVMSIFIGMLTGCGNGSDSEYIETVKQITFDDGKSIGDIAEEKLTGAEFQVLNGEKVYITRGTAVFNQTGAYIFLLSGVEGKLQELSTEAGVIPIIVDNIKWEIEGETKKGKIVTASTDKSIVKIVTEKDGDYIQVYSNDIKAFNIKTGKAISDKEIKEYIYLNNMLQNK